MFLVLSKEFFKHQETKSLSRRTGEETPKKALGGGRKHYRFCKHRGECKTPAPESAREDAEQRRRGSQRAHPTESEI